MRTEHVDRLHRLVERAARATGVALDFDVFTERARELDLVPQGRMSWNGSARLVRAKDGWLAVNLAREDDRAALPALTGRVRSGDDWADVAAAAERAAMRRFAGRAQLLGIPATPILPGRLRPMPRLIRKSTGARARGTRVIDLSSLWAGPLCGHIFHRAGYEVIKVETPKRPDAARFGSPQLFARLNEGKTLTCIERDAFASLLASADIVIENSRPRAMAQLGIDLDALFRDRPGLVWISITAYGRTSPRRHWVGFGDDAGAAGGLVTWNDRGEPNFVGDALADPVAGLFAAIGGFAALGAGGGCLVEVSLKDAAGAIAC